MLAASFLQDYGPELKAVLSLVLAIALAIVVDRAILHRGHKLAASVVRDEYASVVDTRLRFLRRLITLVILVVGVMTALSQFGSLNRLAATVLASSALLAAVVGFAARQTLANLIAGVMLTIAQPLRIGDRVTVEDESGVVEDVRLNYTVVRAADGHRVFIPNERLAAGILRNDTIVDPRVALEITVWLPQSADADRVLEALSAIDGVREARIAAIAADGVRYLVTREDVPAQERTALEARLRADALRALRQADLLRSPEPA